MEAVKKTSKELIKEEREQEQLAKAQLENYRAQVQYRELIARSNKAEFEIMDYYVKANNIESEYRELMAKEQAEKEKQKQDFLAQIQAQVDAQNSEAANVDKEVANEEV